MDAKRNQRILGIAVIIAMAVIIFPLLFSKNSESPTPAQIATITPPPFPDQASSPVNNTALPEKSAAIEQAQLIQSPLKKQPTGAEAPLTTAADHDELINALAPDAKPPIAPPTPKPHAVKSKTTAHLSEKDLLKLKNKAWAIQMGSFKDKTNALRLADKLRAAGYQAFTREVKMKQGSQLRVYVGPEFKQLAALKLSSQIAHDLALQGIIVQYKPLAL